MLLLHTAVSLFLLSVAALTPAGGGSCYFIGGSIEVAASACYVLNTVGASMSCPDMEDCRSDGLYTGSLNGLVGQYDNDTAIWRRSCTAFTWQDAACVAIAPRKAPFSSLQEIGLVPGASHRS